MFVQLLRRLGYQGIDDAMNFVMCGVAVLPLFLMLMGHMLGGAISLFLLILIAAVVGMQAPPPDPVRHEDAKQSERKPPPAP